MCHLRERCLMPFYRFASVYGNQWKIRAWMATIGRHPIGRRIFILSNARCGQSGWYSPPEWAKKRTKERKTSLTSSLARAFHSVYEIRKGKGDPIWRGIRSRRPGTRLTLDRDSRRPRALLECEMSRRGARREINLNPRTRELPALTRVSAPPRNLSIAYAFTGNLVQK